MKRLNWFWKIFVVFSFIIVCTVLLMAQSPYWYSIFIRDDATFATTAKAIFRDSAIYLQSSTDGQLDIVADTEVQVATTTMDLNGIVDISGRINNGSSFWADAPSPANNALSHGFYYVNDFIGVVPFPAATGTAGGWKSVGDATYDVLSAAGTLGGWCLLTAETGSNNEVYMQMGEKGTETFVEFTESSSDEVWFEVNFTPVSVTNAANFVIGLAEEGSAGANFIADAGNDIADKDVVGFVVWEGDPNAMAALWQKAGSAFIDTFETAITVANTTVGLHFDGSTTLTWYVNGTSIGSITDLDISLYAGSNVFPKGEELAPILAVKQGAADGGINIDWIKLVAER